MSSWSTATTRQGRSLAATCWSRPRQRKDQVGLPCTHRSVPRGVMPRDASSGPLSSRCQSCSVPGASAAEVEGTRTRAEPCRVHPGEGLVHQASSIMAVFSPEPTPMHSTRSPGRSVAASWERVIGSEAGPTLPHFGNVMGTRSRNQAHGLDDGVGVGVGDLVGDVAVHRRPVPARRVRLVPGIDHQLRPLSSSPLVSVNMPAGPPTHSSWCSVPARETPPRMRCAPGCSSAGPMTAAAAPDPRVSVANSRR